MDMSALRFDESHTWVKEDGEELIVGVSSYAQEQLGDVIFIELPEPGTDVEKEESFGSIESAKAVEDIIAPVSGSVTRRNDELMDMPELVNEDCYGEGWLIAVKPEQATELGNLMSWEEYQKHLDVIDADDADDEDEDDEDDDLFFDDEDE